MEAQTPIKRTSRFIRRQRDSDTRATKRNLDTLQAFNTARILPFNVLHELVDPDGDYRGHRNACTRLFDAGYLGCRTFNGSMNTYETMSFWRTWCKAKPTQSRTCCGSHFLEKFGRPVSYDCNPAQDEEQVLIDLVDAAFEIGSRDTDVEFRTWPEIAEHEKTPKPLPASPFEFPIGKNPTTGKTMHLVIDGLPGYFKHGNKSQLYVKEVVRFNKSRTALKHKMQNYRAVEKLIKETYGFRTLMVLWVTAAETMEMAATVENTILRHINEEFGVCEWMATHTMVDHIAYNANRKFDLISKPTIPLHLFNEPWRRSHPRGFSLKTLSEV